MNEAIAAKVRKAGVRAELRRWVAIGVLLIINGADLMVMNRQRMSCYDRIQVGLYSASRGLPLMMSAKISDFFTPLSANSRNLPF